MDHLYSLLAPLIFQGDTAVQSDQDVQRMIAEVGSTMKPKFDCIPSFKDAAEYGKWLETFNLFKQIVEGHSFLLLRRDQNLRISADATFAKHDLEAERLVLSDKFASIAPNTIKPWGLDSLLSSRAKSRLVPPFELKLIEPLQPGAESKLTHHVWRAETRGEGGPLSVVIKIFDPIRQSFAETYNQVERKWQKNDTIWRSAREQFLRENWGYSILEDLQGGLLPHSYGFYKVDLPYASGVACHVMEDLGAFSGGQEYLASPPKQRKSHQRSKPWAMNMLKSVAMLHCRGVAWGDVGRRNIMLLPDSDLVVLLDFGSSGPIDEAYNIVDEEEEDGLREKMEDFDVYQLAVRLSQGDPGEFKAAVMESREGWEAVLQAFLREIE